MSLAIPPLARCPRHHRRRTPVSPSPPRGGVRRIVLRFEWLEDRTVLSTFTVTNIGDSGPGSLRQAILDSNAATGGTNTIDFQISGPGVQVIAPASPLPAITGAVLIDGWSQPGFSDTPLIDLDGSGAGAADGLTITGPGVTVRGLDISDFGQGAGIHITGAGATGNWIYGDFLGTDPTGTQAAPNNVGVEIDGAAVNNLVGTNGDGVNDVAERNLLSGNLFAGVWINGQGTDGNAVAGNLIGTSVTGDVALDNGTSPAIYQSPATYGGTDALIGGGVVIEGGASSNRIGTDGHGVDDAGERNVIAGSDNDGIDIIGTGTDGNIVAGNVIGTDVTGTIPLGVDTYDVSLALGASHNYVGVNPDGGATLSDEGNVISAAGNDGIEVSISSDNNVISGNRIGTDATGEVALGNDIDGILIINSAGNTIGGTGADEANVISGNGASDYSFESNSGIELDDASDNLVAGNLIGTDVTGTKALGNVGDGVDIAGNGPSIDNTIGGTSAIAGNLISDNGGPGVVVAGDAAVGNQITANRIFGNTGQAIDLGDDGVTENASTPRQGPNNLQNFPLIVTTAGGRNEGWLGGSQPDASYRIDVFASAGYGPGGAGEAQDYLGSLEVTTDATGQATFDVPFTAPAGLPIITATATDPQGNTSEVSALRRATLETPATDDPPVPGSGR